MLCNHCALLFLFWHSIILIWLSRCTCVKSREGRIKLLLLTDLFTDSSEVIRFGIKCLILTEDNFCSSYTSITPKTLILVLQSPGQSNSCFVSNNHKINNAIQVIILLSLSLFNVNKKIFSPPQKSCDTKHSLEVKCTERS